MYFCLSRQLNILGYASLSIDPRVEGYIYHLRQLAAMEARRKQPLSLHLRRRIRSVAEELARTLRYTTPETRHAFTRLDAAVERGKGEEVVWALGRLVSAIRNAEHRRMLPERDFIHEGMPELRFAQQRILELETELEKSRERIEAGQLEPEDEYENTVKKFNASKNRVFVIMPFNPDFDDVWNGAIKRACQDNGFTPLRVDQVSLSSWITADVQEFIEKSTTVIADITGSNPNVLFELGYALAKAKDPIILCQRQDSGKVPFDISGIRRLEYIDSWQGIEQLTKDLKRFLLHTLDKQKQRRRKVSLNSSKARKTTESPNS